VAANALDATAAGPAGGAAQAVSKGTSSAAMTAIRQFITPY
jgi:hypothetical protein